MLSLLLSVALASEPVAFEPEISNGFRSPPDAHERRPQPAEVSLPAVANPPNPDTTQARIFVTDTTTVAKVMAAMPGVGAEASPYDVAFDHLPLPPNDLEGALMLCNAWRQPDHSWRLRGGEVWLRVDDAWMGSTLR